ncbi:MAG: hypothetical protein JST51_20580 [Armatimonadetes bacterium]|nr:hypothetical protein [Armatimonadota bacterium]
MSRRSSSSGTSPDWTTNAEDIALQKGTLARLMTYFDICIAYDPNNDSLSTLPGCIANFSSAMRSANPKLRLYTIKVPNGYTNESGALTAYDTGNLDPKYAVYDAALASGYTHGILNLQESAGKEYQNLGVQATGTTDSAGTMTTLNDSTATWTKNQWVGSFVTVGVQTKAISGNTRTQLTFATMLAAVGSGVSYSIGGNTSPDGLHPNRVGQLRLAANFKTEIDKLEAIPTFTRTQ